VVGEREGPPRFGARVFYDDAARVQGGADEVGEGIGALLAQGRAQGERLDDGGEHVSRVPQSTRGQVAKAHDETVEHFGRFGRAVIFLRVT